MTARQPCQPSIDLGDDGVYVLSCPVCDSGSAWIYNSLVEAARSADLHVRYMAARPERVTCWTGGHDMDHPGGDPPYECAFHSLGGEAGVESAIQRLLVEVAATQPAYERRRAELRIRILERIQRADGHGTLLSPAEVIAEVERDAGTPAGEAARAFASLVRDRLIRVEGIIRDDRGRRCEVARLNGQTRT